MVFSIFVNFSLDILNMDSYVVSGRFVVSMSDNVVKINDKVQHDTNTNQHLLSLLPICMAMCCDEATNEMFYYISF